jgi:Uncharacterized conserved protein
LKIGPQEIEDIALGAAVLGTGGGGDPYIGKLLAIDAVEKNGDVELIDPQKVNDHDFFVCIAAMGAPTVIVEKIPSGSEAVLALKELEKYLNKKVSAIVPIEQGGLNSQIPIAVAAKLNLPMVDCDGMGRAFPEVQMVTFHLYGISATPMVVCDERKNSVLIKACDNLWAERLARAVTVQMGGSAFTASFPMEGFQLKQACIPNSVTLSIKIGKTIREARSKGFNPIESLVKLLSGKIIFRGKIVDVIRRTQAGFTRGEVKLEGLEEHSGRTLVIDFQNENLIAKLNGKIIATVPDLITILDTETGTPITTEGLKYGQRVTVIGIPCNEKWRTKKGLETVGPRYFGYNVEYVPLEQVGDVN